MQEEELSELKAKHRNLMDAYRQQGDVLASALDRQQELKFVDTRLKTDLITSDRTQSDLRAWVEFASTQCSHCSTALLVRGQTNAAPPPFVSFSAILCAVAYRP